MPDFSRRFLGKLLLGTTTALAADQVFGQQNAQPAVSRDADGTVHVRYNNPRGPGSSTDYAITPNGSEYTETSVYSPPNDRKIKITAQIQGSIRPSDDGLLEAVVRHVDISDGRNPPNVFDTGGTLTPDQQQIVRAAKMTAAPAIEAAKNSRFNPWAAQVQAQPQATASQAAETQNVTIDDVKWQGDKATVKETITDPQTGKSTQWTVQLDWQGGRHVEIVADNGNANTTLTFQGSGAGGKLYMIEVKGGPSPEFWNQSNGVHYVGGDLDKVNWPKDPPNDTVRNIQPTLGAIFTAMGAARKDNPSWRPERLYPGLERFVISNPGRGGPARGAPNSPRPQ